VKRKGSSTDNNNNNNKTINVRSVWRPVSGSKKAYFQFTSEPGLGNAGDVEGLSSIVPPRSKLISHITKNTRKQVIYSLQLQIMLCDRCALTTVGPRSKEVQQHIGLEDNKHASKHAVQHAL